MTSAATDSGGDPLRRLPWPVRTARLSIRPAVAADAAATWSIRRQADVARWMSTAWDDEAVYRAAFEAPDRLASVLVVELGDADQETVVGDLMLAIRDPWAQTEVREQARGLQAELGWSFDPAYQGRGYATEAVEALLAICFGGLTLRRVTADCFAANEPSWRLMERVGLRREQHTVRDALHRSGEWLDGYGYALLADEWWSRQPEQGQVVAPGQRQAAESGR